MKQINYFSASVLLSTTLYKTIERHLEKSRYNDKTRDPLKLLYTSEHSFPPRVSFFYYFLVLQQWRTPNTWLLCQNALVWTFTLKTLEPMTHWYMERERLANGETFTYMYRQITGFSIVIYIVNRSTMKYKVSQKLMHIWKT